MNSKKNENSSFEDNKKEVMLVDDSGHKNQKEKNSPGCYMKARHSLAIMCFFAMFNVYAIRICLSVAIVAMVNTTSHERVAENSTNFCPDRGYNTTASKSSNGSFNWNPVQQGLLLGCFFYGYLCNNILGAWMSQRFGFKRIMGAAMFLSGVFTLCIPPAAYVSFTLLIIVRIVAGFFQGVFSPSVVGVWAVWGPLMERSALTSFSLSGSCFGTFVTMPLAGFVADTLGWEAVFYTTGGVALVWCLFWFTLAYDSPRHHPRISEREKRFILESTDGGDRKSTQAKSTTSTPWKAMLTSPPLFAIVVSLFANSWGGYTSLTLLPTYMATVLKFDLTTSGAIMALPYILQWLFTLLGGFLTDVIRKRQVTSTEVVRKVNTTLALVVAGVFVVLAGYVGCNAGLAIAFFTISVAFSALIVPGSSSNTQDIAPKYSGIIYGISNTIAAISGFLAPQVAGWILVDNSSLAQWHLVFWISGGVQLFGAAVNLLFASGEEQPWADGAVSGQSKAMSETEEALQENVL